MDLRKGTNPPARNGDAVFCSTCSTRLEQKDAVLDLDGPPFRFYCDVLCLRADRQREVNES
jgi:hypothetical protein